MVVTGGLAWAVGRGGGPLYSFTDTHSRIVGFVAVVVTGAALMVVFYAFLLVSLPADQRQLFLGRLRGAVGRAPDPAALVSMSVTGLPDRVT